MTPCSVQRAWCVQSTQGASLEAQPAPSRAPKAQLPLESLVLCSKCKYKQTASSSPAGSGRNRPPTSPPGLARVCAAAVHTSTHSRRGGGSRLFWRFPAELTWRQREALGSALLENKDLSFTVNSYRLTLLYLSLDVPTDINRAPCAELPARRRGQQQELVGLQHHFGLCLLPGFAGSWGFAAAQELGRAVGA